MHHNVTLFACENCCALGLQSCFLSEKLLKQHLLGVHSPGPKKKQCGTCNIWFASSWIEKHEQLHVPVAAVVSEQREQQTVTEEEASFEGLRGVAGRARSVQFTDPLLPAENAWFPYSSATEAMLALFVLCAHPTEEALRMLLWILRHSDFSLDEIPTEAVLREAKHHLPLLPMYEVPVGKFSLSLTLFSTDTVTSPISKEGKCVLMHSLKDWILQMERNPTLQAELHFGAELVRFFTFLLNPPLTYLFCFIIKV
jgi:hypothetical protein